jgi:hypothetical protein
MFFLLIGLLFSPNHDVTLEFYNTVVEMPLGSNPYDYIEIPYAKVIKNGQPIDQARIIYERGVERTFLSVLHTKEVKSFYIKYRAHAPEYNLSQTVTITFSVYDDIPPTITLNYDLIFEVGDKVKFLEAFTFKDNYDPVQSLQIYIFESEVNLNRVGIYPLIVTVKDVSLNETKQTFNVKVLDFEPPEITLKKEIVIEIHSKLNLEEFVILKDNHDKNMTFDLNTHFVDFNKIGTYFLEICASDQSLNTTCLETTLTFVDTTKPELILVSYVPVLEVHTPFHLIDLYQYIVDVYDNYDEIKPSEVNIQTDLLINTIGQYSMTYTIKDQSNNLTSKTLKVLVKDTKPPLVTISKALIFEVFKDIDPWTMYFNIEDNHDDFIHLEIKYQHQLNLEKLGIYIIEVTVKDRSKNEATYLFYAEVIDLTSPEIEILDALIITDFKRPNYIERIKIKDNYATLKELEIIIKDSHIDYQTIGMYEIEVIATDPSGNTSKKGIDILIVDIIPPEITLKISSITIDVQVQSLDLRSYIEHVYDNMTSLQIEDIIISHHIEFGKIGKYDVFYEVSDASLTSTTMKLEVFIDALNELNVTSKDLHFILGDPVNLYDAIDVSSSTIEDIHMYYDEQLHINPGVYEVRFVIYDFSGNHQVITTLVTIEKPQLQQAYQQYLPIITTMVIGLIMSFVLKKYFSVDRFDKHQQFIYNDSSEHRQEN